MSNAIITERIIQHRLASMLGMTVMLPGVARFYDMQRDQMMMALRANGREVHIHVPARDLTLSLDDFAERHLKAAAQALAVA